MGKDAKPARGIPLGSRTERPHSEKGWEEGGRKDEDLPPFDPELARHQAEVHKNLNQNK